jgi:CSLREA domain-containing protein/uncharacterized repeat protein (TIGR01451 family)
MSMKRNHFFYLPAICTALFAIVQALTVLPSNAYVTTTAAPQPYINGGQGIQPADLAATFTVNSADDHDDGACSVGDCTLREAINAANGNAGTDTINFAIGSGAQTIMLASGLPTILGTVTINATTQAGFAGAPLIELNGANAGLSANGLTLNASNCTIRGLIINRFALQGISINSSGNTIAGNYIGTNAAGTAGGDGIGNGENGILITSNSNIVGGTTAADRNVISGNLGNGVLLLNVSATSNQLLGNYIGTNAAGSSTVANFSDGVNLNSAAGNTIGGITSGAGNVISGNANGIHIIDGLSANNLIQGNFIGTNFNGTTDLGNQFGGIDIFEGANNTIGGNSAAARNIISGNSEGIRLNNSASGNVIQGNFIGTKGDGTSNLHNDFNGITISFSAGSNTIGGSNAGEGNRIAFNGSNGVAIDSSSTGNAIQGNSIHSNQRLGINLVAPTDPANGVTPNDAGDADNGANGLQNYPLLSAATSVAGGNVNIQGTLNSNPGTAFRVEFFHSSACDPAGNGEGQNFIGFTNVMTDGSGNVSFNSTFASPVTGGSAITATATRTASPTNTSEFSPCLSLVGAADLMVTKTASPNPVTVGSNLTFTITATNNGPDVVTNAVVSDNLPLSVVFVSCNATNGGVCGGSGNNRTITFPTLAAGASATITLVATADCSLANNSTISNTATISASVADPVPLNNSATSSTSVNHPAAQISPTAISVTQEGTSGSIAVTFPAGCGRTAVSNVPWITVTSGNIGSGNGTVGYTVDVNNTGSPRTGTITVAGLTFTVNQSNTSCSYTLSATQISFNPSAATGSVDVTAPASCTWKALSEASWIQITSGGTTTGSGTFTYSIEANSTGSARSGTINVQGQIFTIFQGIAFLDVPPNHPFYNVIGKLSARGVTAGCGGGNYCPDAVVTREQMAAFILRARGEFNPPTPGSQRFNDVPPSSPFYAFIDRMAVLQITAGCSVSPPLYCPSSSVLREQMAAFIIRALHDPGYTPPPPGSQRFNDVPPSSPFYGFVEEMAVRGITSGCSASPPLYCPSDTVTRAQMAAFLVKAFNL